MKRVVATFVLPLFLGACAEQPASPVAVPLAEPAAQHEGASARKQARPPGSGLVLDSVTGLSLPLIGQLGDVVIDQAVITNFALIENAVGAIVGVEATGVLQLTGGVLGTDVVTEDFTTVVSVTSSGPGRCQVLAIDLGPITIDALVASVDVPVASVDVRASGAVGVLLCTLASLLEGLGGAIPGAAGVVEGINNLI